MTAGDVTDLAAVRAYVDARPRPVGLTDPASLGIKLGG